jgi:Ni,Fe-hydrogenase III small subunit
MDKNALNIYCLGGPLLSTELASIMGDKYREHLSFEPVLVATPDEAQVIVWDGVITPKSQQAITELLDRVGEKTVFLLTGEASTFFLDHPFIRLNTRKLQSVFLPPSKVLPEEILESLELCRSRSGHV